MLPPFLHGGEPPARRGTDNRGTPGRRPLLRQAFTDRTLPQGLTSDFRPKLTISEGARNGWTVIRKVSWLSARTGAISPGLAVSVHSSVFAQSINRFRAIHRYDTVHPRFVPKKFIYLCDQWLFIWDETLGIPPILTFRLCPPVKPLKASSRRNEN